MIVISAKTFQRLKEEYGHLASWAIWIAPADTPKSNTGDLTIFQQTNVHTILNNQYVFVGLNVSSTHGKAGINEKYYWSNFHSAYAYQNDYKLRYALTNTRFWGSYMTDIIKKYPEVASSKVKSFLQNNPQVVQRNIKEFKVEMRLLNAKTRPVLIAMGDLTYQILNKWVADDFKIVKIMHYANRIGKEAYRKHVLAVLGNLS